MVSGHVLLFAVTLLWPAIEIAPSPSAVRSETAVAAGAPRVRALDELAAEMIADGRLPRTPHPYPPVLRCQGTSGQSAFIYTT